MALSLSPVARKKRLSLDWWAVIAALALTLGIKLGALAHIPW